MPPGSTGSHRDSRSTQGSHASRHVTGRRLHLRSCALSSRGLPSPPRSAFARTLLPGPTRLQVSDRGFSSPAFSSGLSGFFGIPCAACAHLGLARASPVGAPTACLCALRSVLCALRSVSCALRSVSCGVGFQRRGSRSSSRSRRPSLSSSRLPGRLGGWALRGQSPARKREGGATHSVSVSLTSGRTVEHLTCAARPIRGF